MARLGRFEEAHKAASPWEPIFFRDPSSDVNQMFGQVRFYLAATERDAAMIAQIGPRILPSLLDGRADSITFGNATAFVCPALARLGRIDDAARILIQSVDMGISAPYDWLLLDPDIQLLRSDPRFAEVCAASRDGAAKIARILEDARTRGELPAYLEQPLEEVKHLLVAPPESMRSSLTRRG